MQVISSSPELGFSAVKPSLALHPCLVPRSLSLQSSPSQVFKSYVALNHPINFILFIFSFIWVIAIFIINKPFLIIPFALLFCAWTRLLHTTKHNFGFCKLVSNTCEIVFPCFTLSKIISSFNHGYHSITQNTLSGLMHLQKVVSLIWHIKRST